MKKFIAALAATIVMTLAPAIAPSADAAGTVSCFDTTQASTTYSSYGINLFRHESKGNWCRDNTNITGMTARRNAIVKVGVGNGYNSSTWVTTGTLPAKNTFQDHYGKAGLTITIPWTSTEVGIARTHHYDYDYVRTATGSTWSRSSSSWSL